MHIQSGKVVDIDPLFLIVDGFGPQTRKTGLPTSLGTGIASK